MYANFSRNICETETSAVFEHIVFAKGLFLDVHLESVLAGYEQHEYIDVYLIVKL